MILLKMDQIKALSDKSSVEYLDKLFIDKKSYLRVISKKASNNKKIFKKRRLKWWYKMKKIKIIKVKIRKK